MNKLKYKPTITSSIPNYIIKADALFERADLRVQVQYVPSGATHPRAVNISNHINHLAMLN